MKVDVGFRIGAWTKRSLTGLSLEAEVFVELVAERNIAMTLPMTAAAMMMTTKMIYGSKWELKNWPSSAETLKEFERVAPSKYLLGS